MFSDKNSDFFFYIPAQNIDCGYSLEPPRRGSSEYTQSTFLSRKKTNNSSIPQFYYIKVGIKGVKIIIGMFS